MRTREAGECERLAGVSSDRNLVGESIAPMKENAEQIQKDVSQWEAKDGDTSGACGHSHDGAADAMRHHHRGDAICIDNVSFSYPGKGGRAAVESVTMHIPVGTRLGIVGPNGSGKSTLLRLILGLLKPTAGRISVFEFEPREACRRELIGYVPQRAEAEFDFPLSVEQVVLQGRVGRVGMFRFLSKRDHEFARQSMAEVGIESIAGEAIGDLSGGQQQRVFIARALAVEPKILILDEPTAAIDEAGQDVFARLMERIQDDYAMTTLVVSHDLRAIVAGCDQVACLNRRLHFHDAPSGLTREVLSEVFEHNLAGIE